MPPARSSNFVIPWTSKLEIKVITSLSMQLTKKCHNKIKINNSILWKINNDCIKILRRVITTDVLVSCSLLDRVFYCSKMIYKVSKACGSVIFPTKLVWLTMALLKTCKLSSSLNCAQEFGMLQW